MWNNYYAPNTLSEALTLLSKYRSKGRIIAGGTDLVLEIEKGIRHPEALIDISRIPELDQIKFTGDALQLGCNVTHNQVVNSVQAISSAFPLAQACWQVGAPQIRNRGTVVGNLITASPANDTITPLWAMDTTLTIASLERGSRTLSFNQFFLGVRKNSMRDDEMVVGVSVPILKPNEYGVFIKFGLRQSQAISVANIAVVIEFESSRLKFDEQPDRHSKIKSARITLGAVAPTIIRASQAEQYLIGQRLTESVISQTAELVTQAAKPISDVRASAEYRLALVRMLTEQAIYQLRDGTERQDWPARPAMLWGQSNGHFSQNTHRPEFIAESSAEIHLVLKWSSSNPAQCSRQNIAPGNPYECRSNWYQRGVR